ncbi:MAG: peptide transporter substrate-binding protein, partial [Proteobacteria bacterium]|nr:peptide transporter substrate-binding protein [Pseudomonadota bacterium]
MARTLRLLAIGLALFAAACGRGDEGALEVAIVGDGSDPFEDGVLLSVAGQHVRAATTEGLVGLDAQGQVIPALADRWIVTDDGRSYIFRLRDGTWADGSELTGESARSALRRVVGRLAGTSLGYDVAQIA